MTYVGHQTARPERTKNMRVGDTVPTPGTVLEWDIDEIMTRGSCDLGFYEDWDDMMECKRMDDHYVDVVESIEKWGFLRPLTAYPSEYHEPDPADPTGEKYVTITKLTFGDGHHRLAAAQDLGMTSVPVRVYPAPHIAQDSGSWYLQENTDPDSIATEANYDHTEMDW